MIKHIKDSLHILIALIFFIISCAKDNTLRYDLGSKRLENVSAGFWIKSLKLNYQEDHEHLIQLISKKLKLDGDVIDYQKKGENWGYIKYKLNDSSYQFYLKLNTNGQEVTLKINEPGIPYEKFLGNDIDKLPKDRKYDCSVVYKSKIDNCRLFLCGKGIYCNELLLLSGY